MCISHRKYNNYIVEGDIAKIELTRTNGKESLWAIIDAEDLERVLAFPYSWHASLDKYTHTYYVHAFNYKTKEKALLQMYIGNPDKITGVLVDHRNHDTLDNRKANLRIVEKQANTRNRNGANINNKSGYRNVCLIRGKWQVQIQIDGKNTNMGRFNDVDEAGLFAEEMRHKYYGEFAGKG